MVEPRTDCPARDLIWETFAWGAEKARRAGEAEEALEHWRQASELAETFGPADPRRAGSIDSLGSCLRLAGDASRAEVCHRQAIAGWARAAEWVAAMPVRLRPSSVSYHRGLQDRHRPELTAIAQHLTAQLAAAGAAAARNNLACVLIEAGRWPDAAGLLDGAAEDWRAAIGARDAGLAAILGNRALLRGGMEQGAKDRPERAEAAAIMAAPSTPCAERFARDCDRRMTAQRCLMAAVYLTAGPQAAAPPPRVLS